MFDVDVLHPGVVDDVFAAVPVAAFHGIVYRAKPVAQGGDDGGGCHAAGGSAGHAANLDVVVAFFARAGPALFGAPFEAIELLQRQQQKVDDAGGIRTGRDRPRHGERDFECTFRHAPCIATPSHSSRTNKKARGILRHKFAQRGKGEDPRTYARKAGALFASPERHFSYLRTVLRAIVNSYTTGK